MTRVYQYIKEQKIVDSLLDKLYRHKAWGVDTETTGLNAHKNKVSLFQIGRKDEGYLIDTRYTTIEPLRPLLEDPSILKVGHNMKFDYKMVKGTFGIDMEGLRCTYLAEKVISGGRKFRGFSLEALLKERFGIEMDKSLQKSFINFRGEFSEDQLFYAETDIRYLLDLYKHQVDEMTRDGLNTVYLIETNAIQAFGDMEYGGMYLDVEGWKAVMEDNKLKQAEAEKKLCDLSSSFISPDLFGNSYINWASPPQVLDLFKTMRLKVPTLGHDGKEVMGPIKKTDKGTLKKIRHYPIVKALEEWRSYAVRINTFGQPYLDAIDPITGAIHPDLFQIGTETGRPAAGNSAVNPLNIPADNRYRHCFIGGPGEIVESDDYSGCESRILAHISGDETLQGIFARGEDIHCAVASMMYGVEVTKDNENKKYRKPAKALNFGIAYGMGPKKLCEDLNAEGFTMTLDEAKKLYYRYCDTLSTSVTFLRNSGKMAAKQGYLVNINGRRRYWRVPKPSDFDNGVYDDEYKKKIGAIEREGGNFLIQSVNADITKKAMADIRTYAKKNNIRMTFINAVYDEIVTRTHRDDSPSFHKVKLKIMQDVAESMITTVPMLVDGFVGPYWNK